MLKISFAYFFIVEGVFILGNKSFFLLVFYLSVGTRLAHTSEHLFRNPLVSEFIELEQKINSEKKKKRRKKITFQQAFFHKIIWPQKKVTMLEIYKRRDVLQDEEIEREKILNRFNNKEAGCCIIA